MNKRILIKFHKEFAKGRQHIIITPAGLQDEEKSFYWQSNEVFNIIKPYIDEIKACYDDVVTDKLLYSENGFVADLIPFQRAYNSLMNRSIEMTNRMGTGTLMVEDGSVDIEALEQEGLAPGKILVYRQGANVPTITTIDNSETYKTLLEEIKEIKKQAEALKNGFICSLEVLRFKRKEKSNEFVSNV